MRSNWAALNPGECIVTSTITCDNDTKTSTTEAFLSLSGPLPTLTGVGSPARITEPVDCL